MASSHARPRCCRPPPCPPPCPLMATSLPAWPAPSFPSIIVARHVSPLPSKCCSTPFLKGPPMPAILLAAVLAAPDADLLENLAQVRQRAAELKDAGDHARLAGLCEGA